MNISNEVNILKENTNKKFNTTMIFLTIILFIYCYFGSFSFFEETFSIKNLDYWKIIYHHVMAFILFFLVGLIYTKFILKDKLKNYLHLGDYKFGLKIIGLATIIVPIICLTTVLDKSMSITYPLINFNMNNSWWEITLYFVSYILYYIGWEYLFRGIALRGTRNKVGALGTILFTTLISSLIHTSIGGFGKPMIETLSAIPAGLIFGYIAHKTDSIYYSLYIHAMVGILTDLFIFFI